jgi:hypothetical protein
MISLDNMKNKAIIFDASTIISFAMACLYDDFRKLHKNFGGHFIITREVKKEVIDKPMQIPRFQLESIKIQELVDEKILELPDVLNIKDKEINEKTKEIMNLVNSTFEDSKGKIKLISDGEASCIALSSILNEKKIANVIAIDERTMRSFCETPDKLKKHLEKKLHTKIYTEKNNSKFFEKFRIIRSIELAYIAYKKELIGIKNKHFLDSLINSLRYKGCSISNEDVSDLKRLDKQI